MAFHVLVEACGVAPRFLLKMRGAKHHRPSDCKHRLIARWRSELRRPRRPQMPLTFVEADKVGHRLRRTELVQSRRRSGSDIFQRRSGSEVLTTAMPSKAASMPPVAIAEEIAKRKVGNEAARRGSGCRLFWLTAATWDRVTHSCCDRLSLQAVRG